jgi:hypothetical protein
MGVADVNCAPRAIRIAPDEILEGLKTKSKLDLEWCEVSECLFSRPVRAKRYILSLWLSTGPISRP